MKWRAILWAVLVGCAPASGPAPAPTPGVEPTGAMPDAPAPSGPSAASAASGPGCRKAPLKSGVHDIDAGGRARKYTLVVPDGYAADRPYPVVFVLHGGGGSAAGARSQTDLERVAAGRAIFVYPQGVGGNWDLDGASDVALFDAILFALHNGLCVEPRRVFVTGFSNGAYMANQLGCRRGDRIRGIVTHAGGGPYELNGGYDAQGHLVCPGKAVASLVVHGLSDTTVAPSEGQKSSDHWRYANRCGAGSSPWRSSCVAFSGCFQPVGMCRVAGLGHGLWKEAGSVTWAFFDALR